MTQKLALIFMGLFVSLTAWATPAQVLIVRHAEKPSEGNGLSLKGKYRSEKLAVFFTTDLRATEFGAPVGIYASKPGPIEGSLRSIQTVTPLAKALSLSIHSDYTNGQISELVKDILETRDFDGKTVVIAWPHKQIPEIASALGVSPEPDAWPTSVYDRFWKIKWVDGRVDSFESLPQRLIKGDSQE